MKLTSCLLIGALTLCTLSCRKETQNEVISQKYLHKYGYAVSREEWAAKNYPGQVISTMTDGVVIAATYENHELHGPCTFTYPNSNVIKRKVEYNRGTIVKETEYSLAGMPQKETEQLSPSRHSLTLWYADGSPRSIEEFTADELLDGQYFSVLNDIEARVIKGNGKKICRDEQGTLLCREDVEAGFTIKKETFYPSGIPQSICYYSNNKLHGEKKTFTESGEPQAVEEWIDGLKHGKSMYFANGSKSQEVSYLFGKKNGLETFYIDGDTIAHQIYWENDVKHGPETYFIDGSEKICWYYSGKEVSKTSYDEQIRLDEIISSAR